MSNTSHPLFRQDSVVMNGMPPQMLETETMSMNNGVVPQPVQSNGVMDPDQEMKNPALPIKFGEGNPFVLNK